MVPEVRCIAVIAGRVQGVGYRAHVAELAARYPVRGTVRNLQDGTVQVEAQGAPAAVEEFLEAVLRPRGLIRPQGIRRRQTLDPDPQLQGFEVAHGSS